MQSAGRDNDVTAAGQTPATRSPVPRDRFRGALLGLAVGDALGAPAEFLTSVQVRERWGVLDEMVGGGCHNVRPGEVTDATEMMLALAESLATVGDFDPEDVISRYRAWFAAGPSDVSLTTRTVMLTLAAGTPWDLASRRAHEVLGFPTAGNGSVMRCAPVALRFFCDPDKRRRVSLQESTLTHYDHLAGWSCVALNELLVATMTGGLPESVPAVAASLDDEDSRVASALREAVEAEPDEIHAAAFVLDSLRAAVWAVLHTTTFEGALVEIVNRGGDCDTVGAVAGALAGAHYGADAIPARWLAPLLVRERVIVAADALADRAGA
jgi:ADP-ribosyl-[dinitrogen reductase] hydrolase